MNLSTDNKKLASNFLFLVLLQFVGYLSPLLVLPRLSRILEIKEFGLYSLFLSIVNLSLVVTDFGFNLSGSNFVAKNSANKTSVGTFVGAVFIIKSILVLIVSVCLFLVFIFTYRESVYSVEHLLLLIGVVIVQSFLPTWFFQGIEKMKRVTFYTLASRLIYILLVYVVIDRSTSVSKVLLLYLFSQLVASLIGVVSIYKEGYRILQPDFENIIRVFKGSLFFFYSRISVSVYTAASTLLVGVYSGIEQAAIYSSAEKLYQGGQSLSTPVSQALYPYLSRTGNKKALKSILLLLSPLMIIGSIVVFYFADLLVVMFYGDAFLESGNILRIFIVCLNITFVSINMGYPAFATINRLDIANRSVILGSFIQIGIIIFLVLSNNLNGINIALGILVTESIVMFYRIIKYYYIINNY